MYVDGDADFEAEVPSHGRDALPSGGAVRVNIFQSGEVRLIDFVEEVLAGEGELDAVVAEDVQVHACRKVEERITWGSRLSAVERVELVLFEIAL